MLFRSMQGETVEVGKVIAIIEASGENPAAVKPKTPENTTPAKKEAESIKIAEPQQEAKADIMLNMSPLARKLSAEAGLSEAELIDFVKHYRFSKKDIDFAIKNRSDAAEEKPVAQAFVRSKQGSIQREEERKKMTPLRKKLAERLVSVKNETAMLTTFNEVNMTPIMELRNKYKEDRKSVV